MSTQENKSIPPRNIECPYCQGRLIIVQDFVGHGYMQSETAVGFECIEISCSASWDIKGILTTEPNWILYPDVYSQSNI